MHTEEFEVQTQSVMRYLDVERLQAKQLAGWRCQECNRPCRQSGESAQDVSKRIASESKLAADHD
ncbi:MULTISPECIES: hypothetical protein [unclassified Leptolyngbya]|uniref:hypothetical protein n=1 Tax=unclassified Leptolyngbya TaxID=2650499 RepID=UPI0016894AC6|nr:MULTISPECIES: hypothetical protein [unclassified Leptolyngbya]MBD1914066.1 hypothetical protein [Leptolyngbya sp. FACHB-8]MBD2152986.1 hypothetical protein [Leptolyngbya sp. FACHB-16]